MAGLLLSDPWTIQLCNISVFLYSLASRWYCEQMKPPESHTFVNNLAEKLKAS